MRCVFNHGFVSFDLIVIFVVYLSSPGGLE